ncbi:MAG: hypothetical protein QM723_36710 [Myxococcaceae bacterium]
MKQRVANYRASKNDLRSWFFGGVGRYLSHYADGRSQRQQAGVDYRARLTEKKWLNYGCGYDKRPEYLNVDMDPACQPDVLVNLAVLDDFPTGHYERILAKDVLEHVPRLRSLEVLLRFSDWMVEGGKLELQTTSILGVADRIRKYPGFGSEHGMTQCLFGSQMHPGDFHYTGFTETTLRVMLSAAGFTAGKFELVDEWMFHFEAVKTSSWYRWENGPASDQDFVREVFQAALDRPAQEQDVTAWGDVVARLGRRRAALDLFACPERMHAVAKRLGA